MKTIIGYITFLLLLPWMWIRLGRPQKINTCKVCLGIDDIHQCLMCEEFITKKACKYQDGMCRKCVSDCCDRII